VFWLEIREAFSDDEFYSSTSVLYSFKGVVPAREVCIQQRYIKRIYTCAWVTIEKAAKKRGA
jgi:hypothetical protein